MKIMIVDDEQIAREKLTEQLEVISCSDYIKAFDNPTIALDTINREHFDLAILDIEMFGMNGIALAKELKSVCPNLKIIFLTGFSNYTLEAFRVRANGYLLKPASIDEIRDEIAYVMETGSPTPTANTSIRIQTFGNFEVFVNGKPVHFERNKSKEILAYLVSRKGAYVSGNELLGILYEDKPITVSAKSQLRNLTASLMKSLKAVGAESLVLKSRNQIAVDTTLFQCDYYDFLKGDVDTINSYMGEFMSNYEWAEFITGYLETTSYHRTQ